MKKLFVAMLTILTCGSAFALPVGNPTEPGLLRDGICWEGYCGDSCNPALTICDAFSIRFGFYGDYVFNRHLEVDRGDFARDISTSRFMTNAAYFAGNFWNRFDIFATFGATNVYLRGNAQSLVAPGGVVLVEQFEVYANSDFSWSVGGRGILWECDCLTLGAEAQYFQTRNHITETLLDNDIMNPGSGISMKWYDWQVGLALSYKVCCNFIPYAAIKWSGGKADFGEARGIFAINDASEVDAILFDMKANKVWGYAIGVTLVECCYATLTAEARFADEKALYINGQVRF